MRAFTNTQIDVFLNAFGESIEINMGAEFKAILETVPVSISAGTGGFIEGFETYCTAKKSEVGTLTIGSVLIIRGVNNTIYNIVDDLSGVVDIYYRLEEAQHFAEDY